MFWGGTRCKKFEKLCGNKDSILCLENVSVECTRLVSWQKVITAPALITCDSFKVWNSSWKHTRLGYGSTQWIQWEEEKMLYIYYMYCEYVNCLLKTSSKCGHVETKTSNPLPSKTKRGSKLRPTIVWWWFSLWRQRLMFCGCRQKMDNGYPSQDLLCSPSNSWSL